MYAERCGRADTNVDVVVADRTDKSDPLPGFCFSIFPLLLSLSRVPALPTVTQERQES